ncbi:MAG: DUF374 domain-containing protein [Elusimicrobia bacterium]|nr:DUF374 domain-containing protein [Elusimicrobiota bacterium]
MAAVLILRALVPCLAFAYSTLLRLTTRVEIVRGDIRPVLRADDRRFIISRSKDGEMIAETIRLCGVASVRGSSSRGASEAVRSLMVALRSGLDVGITPDGPRGPARQVKEGVLFLAQKLGVPILPAASAQSNKLVLAKVWDRFHIPLPFGRGVVVYGEPILVGPGDELSDGLDGPLPGSRIGGGGQVAAQVRGARLQARSARGAGGRGLDGDGVTGVLLQLRGGVF